MSGSLNIYPFENTETAIIYGIQIAVFLVGIVCTHKLIIKPCLRLHEERKKRTVGNTEAAVDQQKTANALEHDYFDSLKKAAEEAKDLRINEIKIAQKAAQQIIDQSHAKASEYLDQIKSSIEQEKSNARAEYPTHVNALVKQVFAKLGVNAVLLVSFSVLMFATSQTYASSGADTGLIQSFWYSIFWPYFQFLCFIGAIVYFARKPITKYLEKRREDFRAKLSEAHEALNIADKKIKEYEAKIASLKHEAEELKKQNLHDAMLEKNRIMQEAQKISESMIKESERSAKEMINRCKQEIKDEIFHLATEEFNKKLSPEMLVKMEGRFKEDALTAVKQLN